MSIRDQLFGASGAGLPHGWKTLRDEEQLSRIIQESHAGPVVIYKHSTRCGISGMALYQLEREWNFPAGEVEFYFVDVIRHRPVSNAVAEIFGVAHHSPQIILIREGKAVYHTSHHLISVRGLREAVK